jgi:purine-nucleoside phosphorylase
MMQRDVHMDAKGLLASLQFRPGDFADTAIISGQPHRAKMCAEMMKDSIKNFTFLGYTFWTGTYKGKRITVGNGGFFAPDSAFVTEILCAGGIKQLIRVGSCGGLKEDISIGDYVIVNSCQRGDGVSNYYVADNFVPVPDKPLTDKLAATFKAVGNTHVGGCWSTDAIFRETKEIVNAYIEKGSISVDMVTNPFIMIANLFKAQAAAVMVTSDNLITGAMGFTDSRFFEGETKMVKTVFDMVAQS